MQRLECTVKNYPWGKRGTSSEVCRLCLAADPEFECLNDKPYAELWMGTHPMGAAHLRGSSTSLSQYLTKSGSAVDLETKWTDSNSNLDFANVHLKFIMKIMSVGKSLSLQVHPNKAEAKLLHEMDPVNYPDSNHKPEMALALTRFELLCGFRPVNQILHIVTRLPELLKLIGKNYFDKLRKARKEIEVKSALKLCFETLLLNDEQDVRKSLSVTSIRTQRSVSDTLLKSCLNLFSRLLNDFPSDVGCYSVFFLNHVALERGQACYYAPNEVHAYLSGDCVECVSNSNNTVRAALTSKHKDVQLLSDLLSYRTTDAHYYLVPPVKISENITLFEPATPDFCLHQIEANQQMSVQLPIVQSGSILIVIKGTARIEDPENSEVDSLSRGDVYYLPNDFCLRFTVTEGPFVGYRTFTNDSIEL